MSSSVLLMPRLLIAGLTFAAGVGIGWSTGRAPLHTELAEQDNAHTREKFKSLERTAEVLQSTQVRGDALTTLLAKRQTSIDQLTREKRDAVSKVTTGRACLGGPALRLLNSAPGLSVSGIAPAASSAAAADGAAAAHTDNDSDNALVSTDTDLAGWAIDAGAQYEICRARLGALIDWTEGEPK
ncbi:MAG: hypothetical protein ABI606_12195 [Rhodoferax sp.]